MRYATSDFWSFPKKPKPWKETELSPVEVMKTYSYASERYAYEYGQCGENVTFFAFSSGEYYKVIHEYWQDDQSEEWVNSFYAQKIEKDECMKRVPADRDWMVL